MRTFIVIVLTFAACFTWNSAIASGDAGDDDDNDDDATPAAVIHDITNPDLRVEKKVVPDHVLRKQIREGLVATNRPELAALKFTVDRGVVNITGTVRTFQDRGLAEAVARTLPGVREVRSRFVLADTRRPIVKASDPRDLARIALDETIRDRLRKNLAGRTGIRQSRLEIEVYGGVAVISGEVTDAAQEERIARLARFTEGVTGAVVHVWVVSDEVPEPAAVAPVIETSPEP